MAQIRTCVANNADGVMLLLLCNNLVVGSEAFDVKQIITLFLYSFVFCMDICLTYASADMIE